MIAFKKSIIVLAAFFAGALGLQAQREYIQKLRFLFLDESRSAYYLDAGNGPQRISASPYAISPPLEVTLGQPLAILMAENSRRNAPTRQILTLRPPADIPSALVVIRPGAGGSEQYTASYINNDVGERPSQSIQIFNLGQSPTAVVISDQKALIPPAESTILNLTPDEKHRVIAKVGEKTADGWRMLYDGVISLKPGERMTAVIVYSPTGLRYSYTEQEIIENGEPRPGHFWLTFKESAPGG